MRASPFLIDSINTTHLLDNLHNTCGHSSSEKISSLPQVERSNCCNEPNLPSFTPPN